MKKIFLIAAILLPIFAQAETRPVNFIQIKKCTPDRDGRMDTLGTTALYFTLDQGEVTSVVDRLDGDPYKVVVKSKKYTNGDRYEFVADITNLNTKQKAHLSLSHGAQEAILVNEDAGAWLACKAIAEANEDKTALMISATINLGVPVTP